MYEKAFMQSATLRALRHARIPRRQLASTSSSSSSSDPAQKKAQEALGAPSAVAARASEHVRHALGPFGARFSGLLSSYQQPVKYNLAVARDVLKHVYIAERFQPPMSLGAVFGTYGTLWARARSLGYWREVVRSGEYARLGVYALEAYAIFKVGETVGAYVARWL